MSTLFNRNFASAIPLACLLFACEAVEEEEMTVDVNGTTTDFSESVSVGRNILTEAIDITGTSADGHSVTISLVTTDTGVFTEKDYDDSAGLGAPQYELTYEDDKDNLYHFNAGLGDEGDFTIEITEFDNSSSGLIQGTFEGNLPGNSFNGESAIEEISLVAGSFSVNLEEEL